MQKFLFFLVSLLTLHFILLTSVSAHILQTDGSIGAIMHVNPDDDPIAGAPSTFFWEFKDTTNQFKIENCDCTVSILQNGKTIDEEPLTTPDFTYTFPEKNVYQIHVMGHPKQGASFSPFMLLYDVRVSRESEVPVAENSSQQIPPNYLIFGFIAAVLLILFLFKKQIGKRSLFLLVLVLFSFLYVFPTKELFANEHQKHDHTQHECCINTPLVVTNPVVVVDTSLGDAQLENNPPKIYAFIFHRIAAIRAPPDFIL